MAVDNKTIKFIIGVDEPGARRSMQLIEQMTRMSKDALREVARVQNAVFGGATGAIGGQPFSGSRGVTNMISGRSLPASGGGDINTRMSQTLTAQKSAFKLLAQENKNALKIVGDQLRQNIQAQEQELSSMTETIEGLVTRYERLKKSAESFRKAGAPGLAAGAELAAKETTIDIANTAGAKQAKRDEIQQLKQAGGGMSPGDAMLIAGSVARAVGSVLGGFGNAVQSEKLMGIGNTASINQAVQGRFLNRAMQGDVRDYYFMAKNGMADKYMLDHGVGGPDWAGTRSATAGAVGDIVGGVGGSVASAGMLMAGGGAGKAGIATRTAGDVAGAGAGMAGGLFGAHMAYENLMAGGADATEARTIMGGLDLTEAANPVSNAAFDVLAQERGLRASSSRRLMGQHLRARGIGAGYGYDFGSATSAAESLQRMGGMSGMFGTAGTSKVVGAASQTMVDYYSTRLSQIMNDPHIPPSTKAQAGVGFGQWMSGAQGHTVTSGGSRGLLEGSFQLAGHGIDMGVGQQALSAVYQATGSKSSEGAIKAMERAVERGVAKGFVDPRTQEELIGTIGRAASGAILNGTQGLERVSAFLTAGGSGSMSVASAQARSGVLAGLDSLGNNPFFSGVNVASAKGILGGKASPLSLMGLSGSTMTELLTGGQKFDDLGISESQRMRAAKDRINSTVGAFANLDPETSAALKANGGDASKLDKKLLRRVLRETKTFGSDQAADAAVSMFGDFGSVMDMSNVGGARMKQYTDGLAAASISMEERTKAELIGKEVAKAMSDIYKHLDPVEMVKKMKKDEEEQKNYNFAAGRMFVVQIVKSVDAMTAQPAGARDKAK